VRQNEGQSPEPQALLNAPITNSRVLPILLFVGFVVTGVVTTILGPILPVFIARWSLDDAQAGFFFTTQFAGSLAGVGLSSVLLSTGGYRTTLVAGYALMAAGIAALNFSNEHVVLAATAAYGGGFGLVIPATNLWVGENSGRRSASALSLLNLSWSIGSLVCPLIILSGVRTGHLESWLFGIAGIAGLFILGFLLLPADGASRGAAASKAEMDTGTISFWSAALLGLLFFLYVGTENGVSGWAAAFSKRLGGAGGGAWELAPMFFWAGLLAGRLLGPLFFLRLKESHIAMSGLVTAGAGVTTLIRAQVRGTALAGVAIAGFGLSILYPIFISWLSQRYGVRARRVGGAMFALAALGGASLPWLVGVVSSHSGSLRVGLLVPLAGCAIMLGIVATKFRGHVKT
jgi:FHS family glucose/mannose:H+ symporter-like MFS transporter